MLNERIQSAIQVLNKEIPNWRDKIDIDKLNMDSCYNCILGQLYGSSTIAPAIIRRTHYDTFYESNSHSYEKLNIAWKKALEV